MLGAVAASRNPHNARGPAAEYRNGWSIVLDTYSAPVGLLCSVHD